MWRSIFLQRLFWFYVVRSLFMQFVRHRLFVIAHKDIKGAKMNKIIKSLYYDILSAGYKIKLIDRIPYCYRDLDSVNNFRPLDNYYLDHELCQLLNIQLGAVKTKLKRQDLNKQIRNLYKNILCDNVIIKFVDHIPYFYIEAINEEDCYLDIALCDILNIPTDALKEMLKR